MLWLILVIGLFFLILVSRMYLTKKCKFVLPSLKLVRVSVSVINHDYHGYRCGAPHLILMSI